MAENEKIDVASALVKKLEEKPESLEHLLNIIDRLGTIDEFSAILTAQKEAATDAMVQRAADNITTGLSIMDSFSSEDSLSMLKTAGEKSVSIKKSIDTLDELERSGTLQSLKEMGDFAAGFSRGTTDMMIERMAGTAEKLAELTDALSDESMTGLIKKTQHISKSLESSLEKIDELERSGTLQSLKEMGDFAAGFSRGTTDMMIERMAGTAEKLAELTELTLNYNLKPFLDTGESFINSGTLDDLVEFANAAAGVRRMFTDGLIDRVVNTGQAMIEALVTQMDVKEVIKSINRSTMETIDEVKEEKYQKGGVLSLLSLTKDPEVMHGLKFMMLLSKNLTIDIKKHARDIFISNAGAEKEFKAI